MANVNKVMVIGRLTRDPEIRTFTNGGKVAAFGFAVNNFKKDATTGQRVDEPCFLDMKAFNSRGETGRKLADLVEQYLKKGHQAYFEGHLVMETWEDKNGGGKRSKLVIVVDDLQFLEPRSDGGDGMSRAPRPAAQPHREPSMAGPNSPPHYSDEPQTDDQHGDAAGGQDIPF